jgi:hypothetical protein
VTDRLEVRARRDVFLDGIEVMILYGSRIAAPLTLVEKPDNLLIQESTISARLGEEFLRSALNCAWELGLRPDGFNDTRESMAATKAHLADMRALAFGKLGIEKP